MQDEFAGLAAAMRQEIEAIPKTMRQEAVIRAALVCLLYQAVKGMGLKPLASWKPPRSTRDSIDLVGVDDSGELPAVKVAFAVDPLVELPKLKSLGWVECEHKIVISFSQRADKVKQSAFFLTPALTHLNLYG
ncbi:MAG: hypothetical protein C4525_00515 [Desulfarculus sp.]|jgi:hypothetical protein|nr:MAG: hypothetical protein C4525_00515 [Desulfarculus sp.]